MKDDEIPELDPNEIVRVRDGRKVFGYGPTQRDKLIKEGVIPAPIPLSPGGWAKGWFGWQINDYHRKIRALAARDKE